MVWGVCRRLLDHHDAEDAFQATFLVLVRKAASVQPREMVANWLYGVVNHAALHARRTLARRRAQEKQVKKMPEPASVEQDLWNDVRPLLDQELSRLSDKYRAVVVLCDLEGRSRKEAARQLGLPEGTVGSRLARARTMLAKRLGRRGLALSGGALTAVLRQNMAAAAAPSTVVSSTIKAASVFWARHAAAGVISGKVVAMTEGVLKAMLLAKIKTVAVVLLVLGTVVFGGAALHHGRAGIQPARETRSHLVTTTASRADESAKPMLPSRSLKGKHAFLHLSWSPDGKNLAAVTQDRKDGNSVESQNAVAIWDVRSGSLKRTLAEAQFKVRSWTQAGVGWSADGKIVAAVSSNFDGQPGLGRLVLWDASSGKIRHELKHEGLVQCLAFSPDGKLAATGTGGNIGRDFETVKLWDVDTGRLLRTLETTNQMAVKVAFAPDSKRLAVILFQGEANAEVVPWDAADGKPSQTLPDSDNVQSIAFAPDGKTLLGASATRLRIWDVTTCKTVSDSELRTGFSDRPWSAFAFSPDAKTLALSGKQDEKHVIALYDVKTAKRTETLQGHEGFIFSLSFSPDGNTLASGSEDKTIFLWDLARSAKHKAPAGESRKTKQDQSGGLE